MSGAHAASDGPGSEQAGEKTDTPGDIQLRQAGESESTASDQDPARTYDDGYEPL